MKTPVVWFAASIVLAGLFSALSLAAPAARAQDVFSSGGGSSEWDKAPVRGTGNPCQQKERLIQGRWVTSQNGSCFGDDRNAPPIQSASQPNNSNNQIIRPKGWSRVGNQPAATQPTTPTPPRDVIIRPPGVNPPGSGRRSNGYLGLSPDQAARLQAAQNGRINNTRDASIFNGLAKEKGIPAYSAGPQDSNVGQNFGFGQSAKPRNLAKPRTSNATSATVTGRILPGAAGNGTSYGRNYGGVQY